MASVALQLCPVGTRVAFEFTLDYGLGRRSGTGEVTGEAIVGTWDAVTVRVEESPDYAPGTYIGVRTINTRRLP